MNNNNTIVPLQDSHEENQQTIIRVESSKKGIKKWVALAIVLIITIAVALPILLTSKKTSNRSLSGKCHYI